MKRVVIIIVNWNGKKDTLDCLRSLRTLDRAKLHLDIVVVDNASHDNSVVAIRKQFPNVLIHKEHENKGFTGANNEGIKLALARGADYIWLLNNDTTVDRYALRKLVGGLESTHAGIAGSKIYFSSGHEYHASRYTKAQKGKVLWYSGGIIDWDNMYASHRGVDEVDVGQYDVTEETQFVTGCSMLISKKVVETIGMLDERFFLYLEDLDFSLRAKRAGFSLLFVPTSVIWHKNAGSTARPGNKLHEYYFTRNRLLVGFLYASMRAKFALLREAIGMVVSGPKTKRDAVIDFMIRRFGRRYVWTN